MAVVSIRALLRYAPIAAAVITVHALFQARMAVMRVRVPLRDANSSPEAERRCASVPIARPGNPLTTLVPVDSDQTGTMAVSSEPGLIESRNKAEDARAEGRTTPLEAALRDLDSQEAPATRVAAPADSHARPRYLARATRRALRGLKAHWAQVGFERPHAPAIIVASRCVLWKPPGRMSGDCLTRRPLWP
jgi:hypothetical protein